MVAFVSLILFHEFALAFRAEVSHLITFLQKKKAMLLVLNFSDAEHERLSFFFYSFLCHDNDFVGMFPEYAKEGLDQRLNAG